MLALFISTSAAAQKKVTISGHITDIASGETLIGAGILEKESGLGAVTNNFGYYTLTIPSGEYDFHFSYVGYSEKVMRIDMRRDTVVNVALEAGETLSSSHIVARKDAGIQSTYLGAIDIPAAQIKNTPVLFGEASR